MKRTRYTFDVNSGLSQLARILPEQGDTFVQIDEKTESELLSFIYRFSSTINYYNLGNKKEGDWQFFFSANPHLLLSILNDINVYSFNFTYDKLSDYIRATPNVTEQIVTLEKIFIFLYQLIMEMHATYERISKIIQPLAANPEEGWQDNDIIHLYKQLFIWREDLLQVKGVVFSTEHWPILEIQQDESFVPSHFEFDSQDAIKGKIIYALSKLEVFFGDVQGKYAYYLSNGKYLLKKVLQNLEVFYEPHLGVVKSFLKLYQHLQDKINLLPKRHLDFYYQQILGQLPAQQQVDSTHLIVTIGNSITEYLLKKDTLFIAEFPELEKKYLYRSIKDTVLNQAQLVSFYNILISADPLVNGGGDSVGLSEKIVYQSSYDVEKLQLLENINNNGVSLFGEDPTVLSSAASAMENAKYGFLVGSEILYQPSGKRTFSLHLYLSENSFDLLKNYVQSFSKLIGKNEKVVANDLFKAAFNISITTEHGWFDLDYFSVKCDLTASAERVISYNFQLREDQPAISVYKSSIHTGEYPASIPLLYFSINPHSFHNAYSFLKGLVIDRIGFDMNVSENSQFILSNNLGLISTDNPFTPFGPQPSENAYFDIQNENIFNKFTNDFSLQIEWFNLPSNEGGFKEYYKAYGQHTDNDSFEVGVSAMEMGKFKPDVTEQQQFKLFESHRKDDSIGLLKPFTKIQQVDFGKLKFSNDMSLEKESEQITQKAQKGIIRVQLISPTDPFGHKIYPKLFSDTTIHNSKKFVSKLEMPKEPFTPFIKSINVSYRLESVDILNRGLIDEKFETDICFIHVHPFGYDLVYPNPKQSFFKLIPEFSFNRQFYLGFKNIAPSDELSLFFELKDFKPTHSIIGKSGISWCFLQKNKWLPFPSIHVLGDTTDGFIKSGIVTIQLPPNITNDNTILAKDIYWISAQVTGNLNYSMELNSLFTNAVVVERVNNSGDFHLLSLPASSISQTETHFPEIDQIFQPYTSFGGVMGETSTQFNTRVGELLRSKNRFITTRDLTQAILNHFPTLAYVQCMANGRQIDLLMEDMDVLIMVVPGLKPITQYDENQLPSVDYAELHIITSYVRGLLPASIKFVVTNPVYEFIKVKCCVQFEDSRLNQKMNANVNRLNEEIIHFISPWLSNSNVSNYKEGRVIYVNDLINFIKKRPYVNYVTGVSLLHFYKQKDPQSNQLLNFMYDTALQPTESISATISGALLVPMVDHIIKIVNAEKFFPVSVSGISNFKLGKELILSDGLKQISVDQQTKIQTKLPTFTLTLKL